MQKVRWERIRGVNFITSYAQDAAQIWSRYDREIIDRELWFAESIGFNSVRLWLHSEPYFMQQERMLSRLDDCLTLCQKRGFTVLPVLFDSCGVERIGHVKVMTIEEVYRNFLKDNRFNDKEKEWIKKRVEPLLKYGAAVQVPYSGSPGVLLWQWWRPNPGLSKLGKENWSRLERYTEDIVRILENHKCVIGLDVMNEPWVIDYFRRPTEEDKGRIMPFVKHFTQFVKEISPEMSITVGACSLKTAGKFEELEDIISFHSYQTGQTLKSIIEDAEKFAEGKGKPILLTECLGGGNATNDMEQLKHYQENLPIVIELGIGWYQWGLVYFFTGLQTDIINSTGFRKPAAVFIAETLKRNRIDQSKRIS